MTVYRIDAYTTCFVVPHGVIFRTMANGGVAMVYMPCSLETAKEFVSHLQEKL